jgi:hypothetical protein
MNINGIVEERYQASRWRELVGAPISALRGVSPAHAKALSRAFGVNTIGELAELPLFKWASAIKTMASAEAETEQQAAREALLDDAVAMTFPASDPIAIEACAPPHAVPVAPHRGAELPLAHGAGKTKAHKQRKGKDKTLH